MTNLVSHLRNAVREHPEETALSVGGNETSYVQLWAMAGRFAAALVERGVEPGDPVALYLPNLPQFVVAFHGALRAGGVVVPVDPGYGADGIRHLLGDSAAVAVVTTTDRVAAIEEVHEHTRLQFMVTADGEGQFSTGFADFIDTDADFDFWELANRDDGAVAALPYTAGTTGTPKGVRLTHGNLVSAARAAADLVPGGIDTDDAALGALALSHVYGATAVMNATLLNGGTVYPMAEWDPGRALRIVKEEFITLFHGVPAMYNDMLHHEDADEYTMASVRLAGVGGSRMPVEVLREFEERFDVTVYEGYGLTETSAVTHFNAPERGRRVGSVGEPVPGVEARVVDEDFEAVAPAEEGADEAADLDAVGEIVVAGPTVMEGYHGLPEADEAAFTERDGRRWFHTGDVGYRDGDGYYYVLGRQDDVIAAAGDTVYPREIEELLYEHAAIADAAVVGVPASETGRSPSDREPDGVPEERRGETVAAFVVPAPGADLDEEAVREHCLEHLAEHKRPRVVEFVDALPRTSAGTVRKHELREAAEPVAAEEAGEAGPEAAADGPAEAGTATAGEEGEADGGTEPGAETAGEADAEPGAGGDLETEAGSGADAEAAADDGADAEAGTETAGEADAEAGAEIAGEADAEAAAGGDLETETGSGADAEAAADDGADAEPGTEAADEADAEPGAEIAGEADAEAGTGGDLETETGSGAEPGAEAGTETADETDAEPGAEPGTADEADADAEAGAEAADEADPRELEDIDGVSDNRAETLREAGFGTVEAVREASREELAEVDGIGEALADRIKSDVEGADG